MMQLFHEVSNECSRITTSRYSTSFSSAIKLLHKSLRQDVYNIDIGLIDIFFQSMEFDLNKKQYDKASYEEYIYGSAEVVGLMCLYVFCEGNKASFNRLQPFAKSLGAAFQKVNFLRDLKADYQQLNRMYFPSCDFKNFTEADKAAIEKDIQQDFDNAYQGI